MNIFSTSDLNVRTPVVGWNDAFSARIEAMDFKPTKPDLFAAKLADSDLGPLRLARLTSTKTLIERGEAQIARRSPRSYLIILLIEGSGEISHYGNTIAFDEGDMVLCDSAAPLTLNFGADVEALLLRVGASTFKEHCPSPESFCGLALRGKSGLIATATAMTVSLFNEIEAELPGHYQERVARHLLDIIATAFTLALPQPSPQSSIVSGRHANVKLFIEQHLRDPELTPCMIASRMKLSQRYLRAIFANEQETVSAYILRHRLEQCARQIGDPAWAGHSITEIAFGWGFNSAPHFSRTFRDRFDMAPREYRRLKLNEAEAKSQVALGRPSNHQIDSDTDESEPSTPLQTGSSACADPSWRPVARCRVGSDDHGQGSLYG
ncbi:helix-turn-helix domain-containing protein [Niveispirillum sp. KHB5.9]|uniref:AraC-like ligand-binding domain-containing protein n=1 Tax=Niveispirillum sp. KHB5.9 TaxID=3400269 RepID=UPI003A86DECE